MTNGAGASLRETIWLGEIPIAVVAEANTVAPKIWWVTNDHLGRPVQMTDAARTVVWRAHDRPLGEMVSATGSGDSDMRFPGQWL